MEAVPHKRLKRKEKGDKIIHFSIRKNERHLKRKRIVSESERVDEPGRQSEKGTTFFTSGFKGLIRFPPPGNVPSPQRKFVSKTQAYFYELYRSIYENSCEAILARLLQLWYIFASSSVHWKYFPSLIFTFVSCIFLPWFLNYLAHLTFFLYFTPGMLSGYCWRSSKSKTSPISNHILNINANGEISSFLMWKH